MHMFNTLIGRTLNASIFKKMHRNGEFLVTHFCEMSFCG